MNVSDMNFSQRIAFALIWIILSPFIAFIILSLLIICVLVIFIIVPILFVFIIPTMLILGEGEITFGKEENEKD